MIKKLRPFYSVEVLLVTDLIKKKLLSFIEELTFVKLKLVSIEMVE